VINDEAVESRKIDINKLMTIPKVEEEAAGQRQ
jgi:hypothetical protein